MPFKNVQGTGVDFSSPIEALNALQRNTQLSVAFGTGAQSFTGSVIYAIVPNSGTVAVTDTTQVFNVAAPGLTFPFGAPLPHNTPGAGGSITVTPSNLSTVFWTVIYK